MIRLTKLLNEIEKRGAAAVNIDADAPEFSMFYDFVKKIAAKENLYMRKMSRASHNTFEIHLDPHYVITLEKRWDNINNAKDKYLRYYLGFSKDYGKGIDHDRYPDTSKKFHYEKSGHSILQKLLNKSLKYTLKHGLGS